MMRDLRDDAGCCGMMRDDAAKEEKKIYQM
jgi:hypothetical protein